MSTLTMPAYDLAPAIPAVAEDDADDFKTGDQLTLAEFERRYDAHPEIKKAELIEGVVRIMSPVKVIYHADPHANIIIWLGVYTAATSDGIYVSDNPSVRLNRRNMPQPDVLIYIRPELGGRTRLAEDGYLEGAPELIVEISSSSSSYDLGDKKSVYAKAGVQEYIVAEMPKRRLHWFTLDEGEYTKIKTGVDGIYRSRIFPGLWLKAEALWDGYLREMLAVLQQGLASTEHAAFVENLQSKIKQQEGRSNP